MKARLWHATVSGGVLGLLVGIALQIGLEIQGERAGRRLAEEFAPWPPPNMISLLRPEAIPFAVCAIFAALGSFVYVVWLRFKS